MVSSFTGLGIGPALIQHQQLTRAEISSSFWLHIFTGIGIFVLISALAPVIAFLLDSPIICKLLPLIALSYPVGSPGYLYSWLLEKDLNFSLLAKQEIFAGLIAKAATIIFAFSNMGIWSLAWGYLIESILISLLRIQAGWTRWQPLLHFQWNDLRKFLRFGFYQIGEGAILNLGSRLDQMLISCLLGVNALGIYDFVATRLLTPLNTISLDLLRNAFPFFAKLQYDRGILRQNFLALTRLLNSIDSPLMLGAGIIAPILIPSLFGKEWLQAVPLVPLIAVTQIFRRINNQSVTLVLATGKPEVSFRWNLLLIIAGCAAVATGSLSGGIKGVAIATLLIMGASTIVGYFVLIKPLLGGCGGKLIATIIKPALLSVLIATLIRLSVINDVKSTWWLIFSSIAGLVLYSGLLWMMERKSFANWSQS